MAEIGGVAVAANAFADLGAATGGFRENSLRYLWESDVERPRLKPGFVIREATELEAQGWRNGRATAIRDGHNLDPSACPCAGAVSHGARVGNPKPLPEIAAIERLNLFGMLPG